MQDSPTPEDRERWTAFGLWVKRELDRVKDAHGWSVQEVGDRMPMARSALYRWMDGDLRSDPTPDKVNRFCDVVGADRADAYRILKWGRYDDRPAERQRQPPDAIRRLMRKLEDPDVSDAEKAEIIRHVEWLASRPTPPAGPSGSKRRKGSNGGGTRRRDVG
jgi:transcriptional regulator with XRE-family HTH domain